MFCSKCGSQLPEDATFCNKCGNRIGAAQAPVRVAPVQNAAPAKQLRTNRSLVKFFFLTLITFGIYAIVVMSHIGEDINTVASRYDGKHTMHYCIVFFLLTAITLGIVPLVWYTKLSNRIGTELSRRHINYQISGGTFWGWCIFGTLLFGVGPFIYHHRLMKSMNLINESYNRVG